MERHVRFQVPAWAVVVRISFWSFSSCWRSWSSVHDTTRISTDHLQITAYVRDEGAVSFSLVLDINPRERIRIYAPGAADDRGITLTVAPTPFLQFQSPTFSSPERLRLAGPDDGVAIYRKSFRVIQDVAIRAVPGSGRGPQGIEDVIVRGVLGYQACNDQLCFPPASVPLSWTVALRR